MVFKDVRLRGRGAPLRGHLKQHSPNIFSAVSNTVALGRQPCHHQRGCGQWYSVRDEE